MIDGPAKARLSWFEESQLMTAPRVKAVAIRTGDEKPHLSEAQKAFNVLIRQIETERARLGAWEAAIPSYRHKYSSEMLPLVEASEELQVRMVHCLDRASNRQGLTKREPDAPPGDCRTGRAAAGRAQ